MDDVFKVEGTDCSNTTFARFTIYVVSKFKKECGRWPTEEELLAAMKKERNILQDNT